MGPLNKMLELAQPQDDQADWWQRLLRNNPHTRGNNFEDPIFHSPPDPATQDLGFDKMGAHEQPVYQQWVADRIYQMSRPPKFR